MLTRMENLSRKINRWVAIFISGGCTLAIMGMMVIDSTMRSLFNMPLKPLAAFSEILMVWVCLAGLAHALITGVHVRMTMITGMLTPRVRKAAEIFTDVVGMAAFGFVTYFGWLYCWDSWMVKETAMTGIRSPIWIAKPAIPFSSFLVSVEFLIRLINRFRS